VDVIDRNHDGRVLRRPLELASVEAPVALVRSACASAQCWDRSRRRLRVESMRGLRSRCWTIQVRHVRANHQR
jgi:hypothetical protein